MQVYKCWVQNYVTSSVTGWRENNKSTVKPRCLAPRYLAKLAARHVNVKDRFPAMYFTLISRHPRLSPSPRPGWVSPRVIWPRYVATVGPAVAVQAHKASLLADQRIQPDVLVSVTVVTSLAPGQVVQCPCCLPIKLPAGLSHSANCQRVTHWPTAR